METGQAETRTFKTLRISLTNVCNFACTYCVAEPGNFIARPGNSWQELADSALRLHSLLKLKTVRLTGGEPLLFKELALLIEALQAGGLTDIRLTTNGFLLAGMAARLKEAGLASVNISLDAVDPVVFSKMARVAKLEKVLEGLDAALDAGLGVKLNSVICARENEDQVLPLFEYARDKGVSIRFLELMQMGHFHGGSNRPLFSQAQMLEVISSRYAFQEVQRPASSTARLWETADGYRFGIIANESSPFCSDCDRLRLDSQGNIFGCLSSNVPIRLEAGESDQSWVEKLELAMQQKQILQFSGSDLSMVQIGG